MIVVLTEYVSTMKSAKDVVLLHKVQRNLFVKSSSICIILTGILTSVTMNVERTSDFFQRTFYSEVSHDLGLILLAPTVH